MVRWGETFTELGGLVGLLILQFVVLGEVRKTNYKKDWAKSA